MSGEVWASLFLQLAWGPGTKMLRLGYTKPGSWASFWAILTLVGLVTRAGEWAGGREKGQDLPALATHGQEGAVSSQPGRAQSGFDHTAPWRRAACLRGDEGWAGRQGSQRQEDPSTVHCPRQLGPGRGEWAAISIQGLQCDSLERRGWEITSGASLTLSSALCLPLAYTKVLCSPVSLLSKSARGPRDCECVCVCVCV